MSLLFQCLFLLSNSRRNIWDYWNEKLDNQIIPHSSPTALTLVSPAPVSENDPPQSKWCKCCQPKTRGPKCLPESSDWSVRLCRDIRRTCEILNVNRVRSFSLFCYERIFQQIFFIYRMSYNTYCSQFTCFKLYKVSFIQKMYAILYFYNVVMDFIHFARRNHDWTEQHRQHQQIASIVTKVCICFSRKCLMNISSCVSYL